MAEVSVVETALKALGLVGAAIGWFYQVRATLARGTIKTDLENLEKARVLFGNDDERSKRIESKASQLISYVYRDVSQGSHYAFHWLDLVLGLVCLVGSFAFGSSFVRSPSNSPWQIGIAGVLGASLVLIYILIFDRKFIAEFKNFEMSPSV